MSNITRQSTVPPTMYLLCPNASDRQYNNCSDSRQDFSHKYIDNEHVHRHKQSTQLKRSRQTKPFHRKRSREAPTTAQQQKYRPDNTAEGSASTRAFKIPPRGVLSNLLRSQPPAPAAADPAVRSFLALPPAPGLVLDTPRAPHTRSSNSFSAVMN